MAPAGVKPKGPPSRRAVRPTPPDGAPDAARRSERSPARRGPTPARAGPVAAPDRRARPGGARRRAPDGAGRRPGRGRRARRGPTGCPRRVPTGPGPRAGRGRSGAPGARRRTVPDAVPGGGNDGPDGIPDAMGRAGADTSSAAPNGRGAVLSLEPVLNQQAEFTHTLAPSRQQPPIRKLQFRLEVPLEGGPHGRADDERHAHAEDVVLRSFQF